MLEFVQIHMDYTKAIRQAARLTEAAELCEEASRKNSALIQTLASGWQGEAASAMLAKLDAWHNENTALHNALTEAASALRSAAEAIKQADERVGGGFR